MKLVEQQPWYGKTILDVCCGGRTFWFNKKHPEALYIDIRYGEEFETGKGEHKRTRRVDPDIVMDFRKLDLPDDYFSLVVFDPPHLVDLGAESFMAKMYGRLDPQDWREDLHKGFAECFRVLKPGGTLVFKWNEHQIPLKDILVLTPYEPLFGHRSGKQQKTHWLCFMK